ncbi:MAG: Aldehyde dehydrogenase B [Candidatus Carbobacillus altaicus]|uniref:3-sulfolactaldehyde dehydrogenase n=1 Tax=Candidatus Carbonibacillus altaicus TaxID=2163959 RepID=A0A2R6Y1J7_9BACL|nr:MAG: Aldehyde dehydrogenase B [Candidatus Carbobacillus altaicus]PTQ57538.1 MAG: Aldehyde dehydrogenase B [Candidatus Carbobacillus altaicus]
MERLYPDKVYPMIDGTFVDDLPGAFKPVINPATGEALAEVWFGQEEVIDRAVEAAERAQKAFKRVPAPKRAEYLYRLGALLRRDKEKLSRLLTLENGKPIDEARGEVQEGIDMAFYMAGEGRRLFGQTTPAELPDKFAMSVRAPIGVVGLITPWNFPIAIATWKAFPALVSGNAVIWKPASETPLMADALSRLVIEAGFPQGVFNVVYVSGGDAIYMVEHPKIKVISFTGSTEVGRTIAERGGRLIKRVSLEMGGKNAVIVMEDADLDLATEAILWCAYGTSGQRCTACSRVLVHVEVKEALEKRLLDGIRSLKVGSGLDEAVRVGPVINRGALEKIHHYVEIGQQEGARLLIGGHPLVEAEYTGGYYYAPTLFTDVPANARIAQEEIFGPVLSIIPIRSLEEAIEINNDVMYGLSSSIFTRDVNRVFRAMQELDTGIVYVNAGTTGAEIHLPFGGSKMTGNGHRDSGIQALDVFTEWKSIYVDYSGKLQRAQIDVSYDE